jgi:hypothetical protein
MGKTLPPRATEAEDAPTTNRMSVREAPIEVITRGERRRIWAPEQKRDIVMESLEPARVLLPGSRLAVAVWGALERQPFYVALTDGLAVYLPEHQNAYALAFSLNMAAELRTLASDAGLQDMWVRFEHRTIRYPDLREFFGGFMQGTMISAVFMALPEAKRVREPRRRVARGLR